MTNYITSPFYILIIILLFSTNSVSQVYQKLEKVETNHKTTWTHFFDFKSNGSDYSVNGIGEVTILKPSANAIVIGKKIDIGKNEEMQCGGSINLKPCVFLKKWDERSKKESIYAAFYNEKENLAPKDAKKLFHIDYNNNKSRIYYPKNTLRCISSNDESKFLIYYTAPYNKKENFKLGCFLGNNNFEKLTFRTIELPFEAEYNAIRKDMVDIKITNNGTIYLLVKYFINSSEDNFVKKEWNHKFFLSKITSEGKVTTLKDIKLSKDELYISSMSLVYSSNKDNVEMFGTAISSKSCQPVLFKYGIGTDDFKQEQYINFPIEITADNNSEVIPFPKGLAFNKNSLILPSWTYKIRNIITQKDDSYLIIGEQYATQSSYHSYGKMLLLKVSPENKIQWTTTASQRKTIYRESSKYSFEPESFVTQTEKFIYLIYNTEFDLELDAYKGSEKEKLDRMTFLSINSETGEKVKNNSIYLKKSSSGFLPSINALQPNNIMFKIDGGGRVLLD